MPLDVAVDHLEDRRLGSVDVILADWRGYQTADCFDHQRVYIQIRTPHYHPALRQQVEGEAVVSDRRDWLSHGIQFLTASRLSGLHGPSSAHPISCSKSRSGRKDQL